MSSSVDKQLELAYYRYKITDYVPVRDGYKFVGWIYRIDNLNGDVLYQDNEPEHPGDEVVREIKARSAANGLVLVNLAEWEPDEAITDSPVEPSDSSEEVTSSDTESQTETETEPSDSTEVIPNDPTSEEGQLALIKDVSSSANGELMYDSYDNINKQSFFIEKDELGQYKVSLWFTDGNESRQVFGVSDATVSKVEKVDLNGQKFVLVNAKDVNGQEIAFVNTYADGALQSYRLDGGHVENVSYDNTYKLRFYDSHYGDYGTGENKPLFYDLYWQDNKLVTASSELITEENLATLIPNIKDIVQPLIDGGAVEITYRKFSDGKYAINYKVESQEYAVLFSLDPGYTYYYSHVQNPDNQIDKAISFGNYGDGIIPNRLW